jgi:Flp pilus assembly CpaE family ATPase
VSQRIFLVTGAKGGVGATTIAIRLVQRFPALGERMIVDADLAGRRGLAVWYDLSDDLDLARVIGSATVATSRAGPMVMELARTYEDGLLQTRASVERALASLSDQALIVVDAPQPFASTVRPFIARATKIIVVTEPTTMGVEVARALLAALDRFGVPATRIALVTSDVGGRGTVSRADIERELKVPVSAELADDRDRRSDALFDGFVTMLAAAPVFKESYELAEKPVFDRRADPVEVKP